jgi:transcriptional regulator with XRE-family HTH domain
VEKKFHITVSGKTLAFYREKAGFTQEDLAKRINSTRVTVANWETKDRVTVKDEQAQSLLKALNVSVDVITMQPQENTKGRDILSDPLVKSFVDQINLQKELIEFLKRENTALKQRLGE